IIWGGTLTGSFSLKNAYKKLQEGAWNLKEQIWRIPWKFQRPQRARRGLGHDSTCGVCGHGFEDALYAIRDCSAMRNVEDHLIPTEWHTRGYDSVLIQSDCLKAVIAIHEKSLEISNSALVRRIPQMLSHFK
ncbi:hypothetical protein Goshw_010255, partial [Gossypium schwendimanii]|nr:hypothetical protein [Gossypium schwendimanii]